ncbi:MAG: class I SAM-dependent methyltransferase [Clostridiales bacterium]|nr:class I SAM-dependent methyltransferase [Clostridiales bacterium]
MRIRVSDRLKAIVSLVRYDLVADIGSDHAYALISGVKAGVIKKGVACDINAFSVERARRNVYNSGLADVIDIRLGDGFSPVVTGEADCAILSGMGGSLICGILENGKEKVSRLKQLALSPQSDVPAVRRKAHDMGFKIDYEDIAICGGEFYNLISCLYGEDQPYNELDYVIGKKLMENPSPRFVSFAAKEADRLEVIKKRVDALGESDAANARKLDIAEKLDAYKRVANGDDWRRANCQNY